MQQLDASLSENLAALRACFHADRNGDFIVRRIAPRGIPMAVLYIDGMVQRTDIEDLLLRPLLRMRPFGGTRPEARAQALMDQVLPSGSGQLTEAFSVLVQGILDGSCAVLCEGCPSAVLCAAQGFPTRGVGQPLIENAAFAPHEAFNESLRTNLTQLHRILHTPDLVTEFHEIGETSRTRTALVYLQGAANEALVAEARRRLDGVHADRLLSIGQLQQLIEDRPHHLLPQMLQTERPDRAASFLSDGMILVLCDNAPYALSAPATFLTFLHTPDDHALRWQYGSFIRIVRLLGFALALLLPALYNALLLFHEDLLPADLLTSILEGYALVPFSVTLELFIMDFIFDLINEASLRMPGGMGSTLAIVGGLVLGQAAVSASLVSPALIIIVSIAGLGLFAIPSYPLSLAVRILRFLLIAASTLAGFAGISLALLGAAVSCSVLESFGTPFFAPVAPHMRHNADLLLRLSESRQSARAGMARPSGTQSVRNPRSWDRQGGRS